MEQYIAIITLVFVASVTPGPNNFVVLTLASKGGYRRSVSSIAGILLGGVGLIMAVYYGAQAIFNIMPEFQTYLTIGGAAYLTWMGLSLMLEGLKPIQNADENLDQQDLDQQNSDPQDSDQKNSGGLKIQGFMGMMLFQFINPKSWVLIMTAVTAMLEIKGAYPRLTLLMIFMVIACMTLHIALWLL